MSLKSVVAALLGVSTYQGPPTSGLTIDSSQVEAIRGSFAGQLAPLPYTRLRWYLPDLEKALHQADDGLLDLVGQIWRAMRRDGALVGQLAALVDGVVALPRRWTGDEEAIRALEGRDGVVSIYDAMVPPAEASMMVADGVGCGIAIGELVPVEGRKYPVLVRRDPQWLVYRWNENRWYYNSIAGLLAITPGDGRWVLHIDKARVCPWAYGLWFPLGQSWINKSHAQLYKANWEAKLANPARVAIAPQGTSQEQKLSWFRKVMAWGINTVFALTPGYEVKLLESNGRGHDSFVATIAQSEREYALCIAGQSVTTDGGTGFSNEDVHRAIRADIITGRACAWCYTVNTQIVPPWVANRYGKGRLSSSPALELDARPPKNLKDSAEAVKVFGESLTAANAALREYGVRTDGTPIHRVDALEYASQFGVPLERHEEDPGEVTVFFDDFAENDTSAADVDESTDQDIPVEEGEDDAAA